MSKWAGIKRKISTVGPELLSELRRIASELRFDDNAVTRDFNQFLVESSKYYQDKYHYDNMLEQTAWIGKCLIRIDHVGIQYQARKRLDEEIRRRRWLLGIASDIRREALDFIGSGEYRREMVDEGIEMDSLAMVV